MGAKDENDRLLDGTLPASPTDGTQRVLVEAPARAALKLLPSGISTTTPSAPADIEAEAALLGALIWNGTYQDGLVNIGAVTDIIESRKYFFLPEHGGIYQAIKDLHDRKTHADQTVVQTEMMKLRVVSPAGYLDKLVSGAAPSSDTIVREYAGSIRDTFLRRWAMHVGTELIDAAREGRGTPAQIAQRTIKLMTRIVDAATTSSDTIAMGAVVDTVWAELMSSEPVAGVFRTMIAKLDGLLNGGLRGKEVTIVAARTSVGKSALTMQMVSDGLEVSPGESGLYLSLEMTPEQFARRMLASRARVSYSALQKKTLNSEELARVAAESSALRERPLIFNKAKGMTIAQIRAMAKKTAAQLMRKGRRLSVVVIDHVGLVRRPGVRGQAEELSEISRELHLLADELNCHIIVLVQITREAEKQIGKDKMPQIHHLKGSGSLEEDADNICILHRERNHTTEFAKDKPARLALAKARNGTLGTTWLDFDEQQMRFSPWEGSDKARRLGSTIAAGDDH